MHISKTHLINPDGGGERGAAKHLQEEKETYFHGNSVSLTYPMCQSWKIHASHTHTHTHTHCPHGYCSRHPHMATAEKRRNERIPLYLFFKSVMCCCCCCLLEVSCLCWRPCISVGDPHMKTRTKSSPSRFFWRYLQSQSPVEEWSGGWSLVPPTRPPRANHKPSPAAAREREPPGCCTAIISLLMLYRVQIRVIPDV